MFERSRRRRAERRVKPGDGRALGPFRWWSVLWRTRFTVDHAAPSGTTATYTVDVELALDDKAELYVDGSQHAVATLPAAFPVPGGVIDVASSLYGMRRAHLMTDDGQKHQMVPAPGTAEHWRARLDHRHPRMSRWIGRVAVVVLLVGLVLVVPQAVQMISEVPPVAELLGTFTSPVSLPGWLNTALAAAGVLAAIERALTLRNHWLIDADTWMFGD